MTRERIGAPVATGVAAELVRGWVELYTGWVDATAAERRRGEIHSDLWEQQAYAREVGTPRIAVSLSIARRAAIGVPADVLWVHKQRTAMRSQPARQKATAMNSVLRFAGRWWWALGAAVLSALVLTMGIGQLLQPGMPYIEGSIQAIIVGGLLAAGVVLKARMPRAAATLIVAGAVTPAFLWWAPLIMLLGIAVLLGSAVDLVRRLARNDAVLGGLSVLGIVAMGAGLIGYIFAGYDAGPVGLMWFGAVIAGVAILLAVANADPGAARKGGAALA